MKLKRLVGAVVGGPQGPLQRSRRAVQSFLSRHHSAETAAGTREPQPLQSAVSSSLSQHPTNTVKVCFPVGQGQAVYIDTTTLPRCNIQISTAWIDHCELHTEEVVNSGGNALTMADEWDGNHYSVQVHDNTMKGSGNALFVTSNQLEAHEVVNLVMPTMKLVVPELFSVHLVANAVDLRLQNKLMGDFCLESVINSADSTVVLDKVKGERILVDAERAVLTVKKALEGVNIDLLTQSLDVQLIHGEPPSLPGGDKMICFK
jgi:hypothetical protein